MTPSNDPLANLGQSLTQDFNQHTSASQQHAIEEHEQLLARYPAVTELKTTRKIYRTLVIFTVFLGGLSVFCLKDGTWLAGVPLLLMALGFIAGFWLHRHAGKDVGMRLTHTHLGFPALDAEIELQHVTEVRIANGRMTQITLCLDPSAPLPGIRKRFGPLMPAAKIKRGRLPQVRLSVYGLELDGELLDAEELMQLLYGYCHVARAHAQLQVLRTAPRDA
ncbi:hypothetical protein ACLUUI_18080 [Enterobacterales bacterium AW_CKDN230030176-1A_HGKHYDSX7]